jgi:toxin ParE1/3/4
MRRIERRPKARFDLLAIYIADKGGEARAERYLRAINDRVSYLAQHPMLGLARSEIEEGTRSFPCDQHVIFYLPLEDGVELVRVIHAAMDLERACASSRFAIVLQSTARSSLSIVACLSSFDG